MVLADLKVLKSVVGILLTIYKQCNDIKLDRIRHLQCYCCPCLAQYRHFSTPQSILPVRVEYESWSCSYVIKAKECICSL